MSGVIGMSFKERERIGVLARIAGSSLKLKAAASILKISYRQIRRIWKRYKERGAVGLVHKSRGRRSPRRFDDAFRTAVLDRYQERYAGFNSVHATEKLAKDGYSVSDETLRLWLIEKGIWKRRRKRPKHRSRREPKAHFGEMLQLDGSFYQWFGDRNGGTYTCLMVLIDDATNTTLAYMSEQETTNAAMTLLKMWIERHGIPRSIYCDKKNTYYLTREATNDEIIKGQTPLSAFGKACQKLNIEIIPAHSPQAKGRVERKNGVFQDRLVNDMRLDGISDIAGSNTFLQNGYLDEHNKQFSHPARDAEDWHVKLPRGTDLNRILCVTEVRELSLDWTVRLDNRYFQVHKQHPLPPPRAKITVSIWHDGTTHLYYKERELAQHEIDAVGAALSKAEYEKTASADATGNELKGKRSSARHVIPKSTWNTQFSWKNSVVNRI